MSISAAASQLSHALARFFDAKPEDFLRSGPTFSDYDGPSVAETLAALDFLRSVYEPLAASGELNSLSRSAINGLSSQLQSTNNTFTQLTTTRDQSSYQNFANALDQFAYHTRMFGVPYVAAGGAQLETQRQAFSKELQTLSENVAEVEALKKDVRTLITPAIAGSLSEAFRQRRDAIYKGRVLWLVVCFGLGIFATYATFDFVHSLGSLLQPQPPASQPAQVNLWVAIAIRTIVLLPVFAAFGFAFTQYRKERDFEEEYAHKAAVANSLPNYGDLAREQAVRDRLVTAATAVIFTSPSEQARKVETSNAMLGSLKEVVDMMSKSIGKK